jgi:GLTT repeat (6 copies)
MLSLGVLIAASAGCGPVDEADTDTTLTPSIEARATQELASDNGLMANGLSANGLSANGLSANGLSANGLSANGLSSASFNNWFQQDPAQGDMVMRYVVRCAVPAGQVRTHTNPVTQEKYTWQGSLGLAPIWASGFPAPLGEQQLVSACMAAHVNKFGVSVSISVLGLNEWGLPIPFTRQELKQYGRKEACFFGNLFTGQGVFFGADSPRLHSNESSARACALSSADPMTARECPPVDYVGRCDRLCQKVDHSEFYSTCTWNGVRYRALTTRVRKSDIYTCGDHVCQISERCGSAKGSSGCEADCGRCSAPEQ